MRRGVMVLLLALLVVGGVRAKDEALHAYLKGADIPLMGLLELNVAMTDDMQSLIRVSKAPGGKSEVPARRARLKAYREKSARMGLLIAERMAPPTGKSLKEALGKAQARTDVALGDMEKALDGFEGFKAGKGEKAFVEPSQQALQSLASQQSAVEKAAELYKKLAVQALVK